MNRLPVGNATVNSNIAVSVSFSGTDKTSVCFCETGGQGQQSIFSDKTVWLRVTPYCTRARCSHYNWTLQQDGAPSHTARSTVCNICNSRENAFHRAEHDIATTKQLRSESGRLCCLGSISGDSLPLQKFEFQVCASTTRSSAIAGRPRDAIACQTRKLCCRKDDRAMRPILCPENVHDSLTTPTANIPNIFIDFCSDPPYECSFKIWST